MAPQTLEQVRVLYLKHLATSNESFEIFKLHMKCPKLLFFPKWLTVLIQLIQVVHLVQRENSLSNLQLVTQY